MPRPGAFGRGSLIASWLARRRRRAGACRRFDVLPALVVSMTVAVWLLDGAAAGADRCSAADAARAGARPAGAFGFGYLRRRAVVARRGLSGRAGPVRLADAAGRGRAAGGAGAVSRRSASSLARLLWTPGPRAFSPWPSGSASRNGCAATSSPAFPGTASAWRWAITSCSRRPRALVGLYGLTLLAVAICAAPATLGDGRTGRARWLAPALPRWPSSAARRLRRAAARGRGRGRRSPGVQAAHHAAEHRRRTTSSGPRTRAAIMRALPGAQRPRDRRPERTRHRRRHPSDLAGIGLSLPSGARAGGAGADRRLLPPQAIADHRRGAHEPSRCRARAAGASTTPSRSSATTGASSTAPTRCTSCPSASICPSRSLLTALGLRQFVPCARRFRGGRAPQACCAVPGLPPVAPLICYEAIFPGERASEARDGAALLLNVTNDAWFGVTPGPYQHFAQARLRTIEEGLPLVRAANYGDFGRRRSLWAHDRVAAARRRRRPRRARCRSAIAPHPLSRGTSWHFGIDVNRFFRSRRHVGSRRI